MPLGAMSSGSKPPCATKPLVLESDPAFIRTQAAVEAVKTLATLGSPKIGALISHLALHGAGSIQEISEALGWSRSTTAVAARSISTGRYWSNKVYPPRAKLLWIQQDGQSLNISLRPEGIRLAKALLGLTPADPSTSKPLL